ncbi:hypothetical protein [Nocardia wallacei]|uniref:hypothetical protein n=1 Tax=Nocardia wallacei TaxID=480035 RepID=UPI00245470BB|nr:hypothetical protein [Nocardia wallacei]
MRYVNLNATVGGLTGVISPTEYLNRLPSFVESLPVGARAFAADAEHYDFHGKRCVKDLKLEFVESRGGETELRFRHNCWKHEEDLHIRYVGVSGFEIDAPGGAEWRNLGDVILDEILPAAVGCTHEIAFRPGTLTVACRDLTATWVDADCPEKP